MSSNANGAQMPGASLAKNLFQDMGKQVESMKSEESADTEAKVVEEIESLCMNCREDGMTKLLLTKIPYFREIVIMSFYCDHCNFRNSEIQSAGEIQQRGSKYVLKVESEDDLQRSVVKTDNCTFKIEEIDLEIPPGRGRFTNIEGILSEIKADLESHQEARMQQMPEMGAKVAEIIQTLQTMLAGTRFPFTVSADDPSGNSFIEPSPRDGTGKWVKHEYLRSSGQNAVLGLGDEVPRPGHEHNHSIEAPETNIRPEYRAAAGLVGGDDVQRTVTTNNVDDDDIRENEVYSFPASCPGCTRPCATNMKMVNIPYFKQVILMSTVCESCGYRSNEVKTGGEVPALGRKITLKVRNSVDMARDVLKSESAALYCPELQLHVEPGTLGGRFTTVEGLLTQFRTDLRANAFGLSDGDDEEELAKVRDSVEGDTKRTWDEFFASLTEAIEGRKPFTMVIEDPLASSYVQSFTAPAPDPQIEVEDYTRTEREEEDLGLLDIKTEGYEDDAANEEAAREGAAAEEA